jgi:catechol 2,3-dioxygenase-like lactoylglutathione lyase family enzyme
MLCKKLHHAGFRCKDARETVDFYTNVLGLKFSHAMGEDHVPSTGEYSPPATFGAVAARRAQPVRRVEARCPTRSQR